MQSFLLVVCIIVLHDSVWIMVTLVYDANDQKWPLYWATERNESKAGQRARCKRKIRLQNVAGIESGTKTPKKPVEDSILESMSILWVGVDALAALLRM